MSEGVCDESECVRLAGAVWRVGEPLSVYVRAHAEWVATDGSRWTWWLEGPRSHPSRTADESPGPETDREAISSGDMQVGRRERSDGDAGLGERSGAQTQGSLGNVRPLPRPHRLWT